MGSQTVGHNWATELNGTNCSIYFRKQRLWSDSVAFSPPTPTLKCLLIRWLWKPREILLNVLFIFCVLLVKSTRIFWMLVFGCAHLWEGCIFFSECGVFKCWYSQVCVPVQTGTLTSVVSSHNTSLWSSGEGCHKWPQAPSRSYSPNPISLLQIHCPGDALFSWSLNWSHPSTK